MKTPTLNKLSPLGREQVIYLDAKLREVEEELSFNFSLLNGSIL